MTNRIRYRLVFNRGGKLNQYGEGLVSIELSLQGRKIYFSTHTYLKPHHWSNGMVVNHPLAKKLNYTLGKMAIEIEEVELDAILQGRQVTLTYMRNAIRNAVTTTARLKDFTTSVIGRSERKAQTKQSYRTVVNDVDRFRRDARLVFRFITYLIISQPPKAVITDTTISITRMMLDVVKFINHFSVSLLGHYYIPCK